MRNLLKAAAVFVAALVITKFIWVKSFAASQGAPDVLARRAYLLARVNEARDIKEMHGSLSAFIQGEWAVGTYSMLTAALTNIAFTSPETREESLRVIEDLIDVMLKNEDFRRFDTMKWHREDALASLAGPNGHLGYLGHLNMMLAAYYYLGGESAEYHALFSRVSEALIRKMSLNPSCLAETYPNLVFGADNAAAMASVALYERTPLKKGALFTPRWLAQVRTHFIDPRTGLILHLARPDGDILETTRGCTEGWCSFYLPFIDPAFALDQYELMKRKLAKKVGFGITGIREFPEGTNGNGDIDSGPIIFDLSTSGTGFAVAGAKYHGDDRFFRALLTTAEMAGFSFQWNGRRRYLLAPLVGDAIMLAMKTATPWDNRFIAARKE